MNIEQRKEMAVIKWQGAIYRRMIPGAELNYISYAWSRAIIFPGI